MVTPAPKADELKLELLARGSTGQLQLAILLALAGLRRSELLALRWGDLVEDRQLIIVTSEVISCPVGMVRRGVVPRAVFADERTWAALSRHQNDQAQRAWRWPLSSRWPFDPQAPVLASARDGTPTTASTLNVELWREKRRQRIQGPAIDWLGITRAGRAPVKPYPAEGGGEIVRESRARRDVA